MGGTGLGINPSSARRMASPQRKKQLGVGGGT